MVSAYAESVSSSESEFFARHPGAMPIAIAAGLSIPLSVLAMAASAALTFLAWIWATALVLAMAFTAFAVLRRVEKARARPTFAPQSFLAAPARLIIPKVPWRVIAIGLVVFVAIAIGWRALDMIQGAGQDVAIAKIETRQAMEREHAAQRQADVTQEALVRADETQRGEAVAREQVREATALIRAPSRAAPQPAINPPNPPPHSEPAHAPIPDPVIVWADAIDGLLDDTSGLSLSA